VAEWTRGARTSVTSTSYAIRVLGTLANGHYAAWKEIKVIHRPKSVVVKLDLKVLSIEGTWEPNDAERMAAWELYVELITRISVVPLQAGIIREALTSIYSLFTRAREILRCYGPEIAGLKPDGEYSLGYLTIAMLNLTLRPLLSYWHPELEAWEARRLPATSVKVHEDSWPRIGELREKLGKTGTVLADYSAILAKACGVPNLHPTDSHFTP
jgi:hypothetical protein